MKRSSTTEPLAALIKALDHEPARRRVLFLKASVSAHTRTTKDGKVVQVAAHETRTPAAQAKPAATGGARAAAPADDNHILPDSPTDPHKRRAALDAMGEHRTHPDSAAAQHSIGPWSEGFPRIKSYKAGKHPPSYGEPPEGAHELVSYNHGKGAVGVWTKRGRYSDMTWHANHPDGPRWSNIQPHALAFQLHQAGKHIKPKG